MPTYHFICGACSKEFTAHLTMGSEEMPPCDTCRRVKDVRKVIKPPMVHFKGSGFYKTDSTGSSKGLVKDQAKEPKETKESKESKPVEQKSDTPPPAKQTT